MSYNITIHEHLPRTHPPLWGDGHLNQVFSELEPDDRKVITAYDEHSSSMSEYTDGAPSFSKERLLVYVPGQGAPKRINVLDTLRIGVWSDPNHFGNDSYHTVDDPPENERRYNNGHTTRFRLYPNRRMREFLATDERMVCFRQDPYFGPHVCFRLSVLLFPEDQSDNSHARLFITGGEPFEIPLMDVHPDDHILQSILNAAQLRSLRQAWEG